MTIERMPARLAVRTICALAVANHLKSLHAGAAFARAQRWADADAIGDSILRKGTVDALDVGDAPGMIDDAGLSLSEAVRPLSIRGRMTGIRRAAFDVPNVNVTGAAAGAWVGPGAGLPVAKLSLGSQVKLRRRKLGVVFAIDDELARSGTVAAQESIAREMVAAVTQVEDESFINSTAAGTANVQPASITYGAPSFASSGNTLTAIMSDVGRLVGSLVDNGSTLEAAYLVMRPKTAQFIAGLQEAAGRASLGVKGGSLAGIPVLTSASVPTTGSPSPADICLVDADGIWAADDGEAQVSVSGNAPLQLLDNPTNASISATPTNVVSCFQTGTIVVRAIRWTNWQARRTGISAVLTGTGF